MLVGALSPVNHKGLHQGWTQPSLYLQVIHFTSYHTTSHVGFCCCCGCFSLFIFRGHGTQHGNLHSVGSPISLCGPTQEPVLATVNTGKTWEAQSHRNYKFSEHFKRRCRTHITGVACLLAQQLYCVFRAPVSERLRTVPRELVLALQLCGWEMVNVYCVPAKCSVITIIIKH